MPKAMFEVDFSDLEDLEDRLERSMEAASNFRDEFQAIAGKLWLHFEEVFRSEGPGWKPLSKRTQMERAALGFSPAHPILQRFGVFAESFMSNAEIQMDPVSMVYRSKDRRAEELVVDRKVVDESDVTEVVAEAFVASFTDRFESIWGT